MSLLSLVVIVQTYRVQSWKATATECALNRKADKVAYESAQREATAKNKADVTAAENLWKAAGVKVAGEYDAKLKAAYSSVARYADGVRKNTARPAGSNPVPETPRTTEGVDGPGEGASVPVSTGDLNVCAENTVKAQAWQTWWKSVVENWPK